MILDLILLLLAVPPAERPCKASADLAGKCFVVRGRLRAYNGNPTFRIWRIGTGRLLGVTGVHPGEEPILPEGLACGFDCDVFAEFQVCPFTKEKPGVMQRVCVESAAKRTVIQRQ